MFGFSQEENGQIIIERGADRRRADIIYDPSGESERQGIRFVEGTVILWKKNRGQNI